MKFLKILVCFLLVSTISVNCQLSAANYNEGNCGKLDKVEGDYRTYAPFIAGIFIRNGLDTPKFFTTGVIIGSTAVLSVARGPFGGQFRGQKSDNRLPHPSAFIVCTGLNTTDFTRSDEFTQCTHVNYLEPQLDQEETNEHYHYVIYHLKTLLDLKTPYVKAICLPYFPLKSYTPFGWEFQFSGFLDSSSASISTHELSVFNILTSTQQDCHKLFKYHYKHELDESQVFCGQNKFTSPLSSSGVARRLGHGTTNGSSTTVKEDRLETVPFRATEQSSVADLCFLHGSALTFFFNGRWRLVGIVTLIPGRRRSSSSARRCNERTIYFFGRLPNHHVDWLANSLRCSPHRFPCDDPEGTCMALSSVCNGISQCPNQRDEHQLLCDAVNQCPTNETTSCGLNGKCISKTQLCDGKFNCEDESDEGIELCSPHTTENQTNSQRLNVFCPPLKFGKGTVAKCVDLEHSEEFDCEERSGPKASVLVTCLPYHVSNYQYSSMTMLCNSRGQWTNKRPFSCSSECGVHRVGQDEREVEETEFVTTLPSSFPWNSLLGSNFVTSCSAVLIHPLYLITSAECVNILSKNGTIYSTVNPVSLETFKNFEAGRSYTVVQRHWIAKTNTTSYEYAILKLASSSGVQGDETKSTPVCFSSGTITVAKMMASNITGKVLSFRKRRDLDGADEEVFQLLDFEIVSKRHCVTAFPNFSIPNYAFCTYSLSGASLNTFETGTGFYVKQKSAISGNSQFALKGIAIGPVMKPKKLGQNLDDIISRRIYQIFANIEYFHDWTLDVMEKYY